MKKKELEAVFEQVDKLRSRAGSDALKAVRQAERQAAIAAEYGLILEIYRKEIQVILRQEGEISEADRLPVFVALSAVYESQEERIMKLFTYQREVQS